MAKKFCLVLSLLLSVRMALALYLRHKNHKRLLSIYDKLVLDIEEFNRNRIVLDKLKVVNR